jgi:hypothetical protein
MRDVAPVPARFAIAGHVLFPDLDVRWRALRQYRRGREARRITLGYRLGQDGQPIEQSVYLGWTRPQFGGRRPWFICPRCNRRVALLYLCGERWACRICCELAYRSELELKGYRGQMMTQKFQARLGGDRSGFEFSDKPRGMHWKT